MILERSVTLMRTNQVRMLLAAFPLGFLLLSGGYLIDTHPVAGIPTFLLGLSTLVFALAAIVGARFSRRRKVEVGVDGLTIDGTFYARTAFESGHFVPAQGTKAAYVSLAGKTYVSIEVADAEEGLRVLETLGFGPTQHATPFLGVASARTKSGIAMIGLFALATVLFTASFPLHLVWLTVLASIMGLGAPFLIPNKILVGNDGVLVKNTLDHTFYSFDEIVGAIATKRGIRLRLRDRDVELPLTSRFSLYGWEKDVQAGLLARIQEALELYKKDPKAGVAWRIERGDRSISDWLASLTDDGDFRHAPLRKEDLQAVLESSVSPWARMAAAYLLVRRGGEEERTRVRVAAEACVAPKLRVAMESIAEGAEPEAVERLAGEIEA